MFACATVQDWFFPARLPDPCKSLWAPFLYHRWSLIGIIVNRVNLSFVPDTSQSSALPHLNWSSMHPKLFLIFASIYFITICNKHCPSHTKHQRCGSPTLSCSSLLSASTSPLFLDCLLVLRMMRWATRMMMKCCGLMMNNLASPLFLDCLLVLRMMRWTTRN